MELLARQLAALVWVAASAVLVPPELGSWMGVPDDVRVGTSGGGNLEFEAIAQVRLLLAWGGIKAARFALGPSIGQCGSGVAG